MEEALLMSFNNTIKFVIDNNQLIHPRTVKARNYIMSKILNSSKFFIYIYNSNNANIYDIISR